jgi:YbbR domain-containing protein
MQDNRTILDKLLDSLAWVYRKVNKVIDRILYSNIGTLAITFILAVVICVAIDYEDIRYQLFNDTTTVVEIRDVDVEIKNAPDEYIISGIPSTVDVRLEGEAAEIQVFRQQNTITVIADLRQSTEGSNVIDLKVDKLPSKITATVTPASVTATINKKVTETFNVSPQMIGTSLTTASFENPELNPSTVNITGTEDQLNSIRTVRAIVDVSGQVESFEEDAIVAAYDGNGNKLDVQIEQATIHVQINKTADK